MGNSTAMMISIEGMAGIESMPPRRYSRAYVSTAVASPPSTRLEAAVPDAGRVNFGKYAATWIGERPGLRPKTIELYRYLLRRHLCPTFGTMMVATGTKGADRIVKIISVCSDVPSDLQRRRGAPSATRTRDLLLRRQLLYPLSYRGRPDQRHGASAGRVKPNRSSVIEAGRGSARPRRLAGARAPRRRGPPRPPRRQHRNFDGQRSGKLDRQLETV
jgi:hypothetical protein